MPGAATSHDDVAQMFTEMIEIAERDFQDRKATHALDSFAGMMGASCIGSMGQVA
jgi:hypothetical protein